VALDRRLPDRQGTPITASGAGTLALNADTASGTVVAAGRWPTHGTAAAQIAGEPQLNSGTGLGTHVFAQIVDEARGVVAARPGRSRSHSMANRTISRPLEAVAASRAGTEVHAPGHRRHGALRSARGAHDHVHEDRSELPTVGASAISGGAGVLGRPAACLSRRRFSTASRAPTRTSRWRASAWCARAAQSSTLRDDQGHGQVKVTVKRKGKTVPVPQLQDLHRQKR
jgi:ABC-2 type transport system ATP-binding protein